MIGLISDGGDTPLEFIKKLKDERDNLKAAGGGVVAMTGPALERIIRELGRLQRAEKFIGKIP